MSKTSSQRIFRVRLIILDSMQTLCPYETVAFGYSAFCNLFTYEEWQGFEYSIDLAFAGNNYFQSPTGRAVGIGFVQEILARLQNHVLTTTGTQANLTLDNNTRTFPLNQTLYFDFSHDTNIAAILTAFGLTQFAPLLPSSGNFDISLSVNRANYCHQDHRHQAAPSLYRTFNLSRPAWISKSSPPLTRSPLTGPLPPPTLIPKVLQQLTYILSSISAPFH